MAEENFNTGEQRAYHEQRTQTVEREKHVDALSDKEPK